MEFQLGRRLGKDEFEKYADEVWKIYFSGEKLHSPGYYFGQ